MSVTSWRRAARRGPPPHASAARRSPIRWLAIGATVFAVVAALLAWNTFRQLLVPSSKARLQAENAAIAEAAAKSTAEAGRYVAETAQAQAEAAADEARQAEATAQAERDRAQQQSDIARSRQVAAVASDALTRDDGALALLLGVSAHAITDTVEVREDHASGARGLARARRPGAARRQGFQR